MNKQQILSKEQIAEAIREQGYTPIFSEQNSLKGDGVTYAYVQVRLNNKGKRKQRSLGTLEVVQAMSKEQIAETIAATFALPAKNAAKQSKESKA